MGSDNPPTTDEPTTDEPTTDEPTTAVGPAERFGQAVGVALILVLIAGAVVLLVGLFQGPKIDPGPNPSFVDTIFASRGVVGAVRVAIIFAVGYMIVSICALIAGRQWLSRVGPIEVGQSVKGLTDERDRLAAELADARETIDRLENDLAVTTQAYEEASEDLQQMLEYVDTMLAERSQNDDA